MENSSIENVVAKKDFKVKFVGTGSLPVNINNILNNYSGKMLQRQYTSLNVNDEFRTLVENEMKRRGMLEK